MIDSNSSSFFLASLLSGYPHPKFGDFLKTLLEKEEAKEFYSSIHKDHWSHIEGKLGLLLVSCEAIDHLRGDYIDIFDRGKSENSPYETEYGPYRGMRKAAQLSDLSGFYKAFGFECGLPHVTKEMLDHISVELEFYALLLMKQKALEDKDDLTGVEIVLDARKKFLNDHLGTFVTALSRRPGVQSHSFYSPLFQWISCLIQKECQQLGIQPAPVPWFSDQIEKESFKCGVLGECAIQ